MIAIEKAVRDAKKNLVTFPIVNGTIPHNVTSNFKAAGIFLHPASKGTGIIAGGSARKIFAVSGVKDILAKQLGTNNPITNARVVMKALTQFNPNAKVFGIKKTATDTVAPEASLDASASKTPAKKSTAKKEA